MSRNPPRWSRPETGMNDAALPTNDPPPSLPAIPKNAKERFELELEFVSGLANPAYLHVLAQQGLLTEPAFQNYLLYLDYWNSPEYVRFIVYPDGLKYLAALRDPIFCEALKRPDVVQELNRIQLAIWNEPEKVTVKNPDLVGETADT